MKKYLMILCLILSAPALYAETKADISTDKSTEEYASVLYEFLAVSDRDTAYKDAVRHTLRLMKENYPDVSEDIWPAMETEFLTEKSFKTLVSMLAPVYEKYFTLKELKEIISFYKTPIGKKYAESSPQITAEAMAVGYEWGVLMDEKLKEKIQESRSKADK